MRHLCSVTGSDQTGVSHSVTASVEVVTMVTNRVCRVPVVLSCTLVTDRLGGDSIVGCTEVWRSNAGGAVHFDEEPGVACGAVSSMVACSTLSVDRVARFTVGVIPPVSSITSITGNKISIHVVAVSWFW